MAGPGRKAAEREEEAAEVREKLREAAEKQEDAGTAKEKLDAARERIQGGESKGEGGQQSAQAATALVDPTIDPFADPEDADSIDWDRVQLAEQAKARGEVGPERTGLLANISEVRKEAIVRGLRTWYQTGGRKDVATIGSLAVLVGAGQLTTTLLLKQYMAGSFAAKAIGESRKEIESVPVTKEITERFGISKVEEYERPFDEFDFWMSKGADEKYAMSRGAQRLSTLIATDLQFAKTRMAHSVLKTQRRQRYRRVIGSSNPCPLCLLASTQTYYSEDLLPIHPNCECDVEPMGDDEEPRDIYVPDSYLRPSANKDGTARKVPGQGSRGGKAKRSNDIRRYLQDIAQQYPHDEERAAEEATRHAEPVKDLDDIVAVRNHGEIGPVLTWRDQHFRGPGDLPNKPSTELPEMTHGIGSTTSVPFSLGRSTVTREIGQLVPQRITAKEAIDRAAAAKLTLSHIVGGRSPARSIHQADLMRRVEKDLNSGEFGWQRVSVPDFQEYLLAKHPGSVDKVYGFDAPGINEKAAQETLLAAHDMMTKYPDVHVVEMTAKDLGKGEENTVAQTFPTVAPGRTYSIEFNSQGMQRYSDLVDVATKAERGGFYFPGMSNRPYYNAFVHEFGHAVDNRGGWKARMDVNQTATELFKSQVPPPRTLHDYVTWQHDPSAGPRVSGYSLSVATRNGVDELGPQLNNPEAVAQAFEDVERRGDQAGDLSKLIHDKLIAAYEEPVPTAWASASGAAKLSEQDIAYQIRNELAGNGASNLVEQKASEADRIVKKAKTAAANATQVVPKITKTSWSENEYHQFDDKRMTPELRADAEDAAKAVYANATRVEPIVTKAVSESVWSSGGRMDGLDFRLKEGPSLYRKIQSEYFEPRVGTIDRAAANMKDSVRYTAVVPEEGQWEAGNTLRDKLISIGAEVVKDPKGIPYEGYRGRNMAFKLDGIQFELQINTEKGLAVKEVNHKLYEIERLPDTPEAKKRELRLQMQKGWDTVPIAKGTPVIRREKDADVWFTPDSTMLRGPTVPILPGATDIKTQKVAKAQFNKDVAARKAAQRESEEKLAAIEKAKGFGTVQKRIADGEEVKPVYALNPDGTVKMKQVIDKDYRVASGAKKPTPMVDEHGKPVMRPVIDVRATWDKVSDETLKENWRMAIRQSAPWAQEAGKVWYPEVNRWAQYMTDKYGDSFAEQWGMKLTPDLMASFIAAYSENNSWAGNLLGIRKFLDGTGSITGYDKDTLKDFDIDQARKVKFRNPKTGAAYDFHVAKALRAMQNPEGGVADLRRFDKDSPKPADFASNIAGDYDKATADRWVARIMLHASDYDFADQMWQASRTVNKQTDRYGYKRLSTALQEVSQEPEFKYLGNAAAVQAVPWVQVVGPMGSIGYIEDLENFASINAETLSRAQEFGDVV